MAGDQTGRVMNQPDLTQERLADLSRELRQAGGISLPYDVRCKFVFDWLVRQRFTQAISLTNPKAILPIVERNTRPSSAR